VNAILNARPLLVVISGPSGVGKDATLSKMKELGNSSHIMVTTTTREKRPGEVDGVDYNFVSKDAFNHMIEDEQLLEWAVVYGNYYGVPKEEIEHALKTGFDAIVKVDVQGAASIRKIIPEAVFIFLLPPSMEELANRLKQRGYQSESDLNLRLNTAKTEMENLNLFEYAVVSYQDNLELTVNHITSIITAEKCRVKQRSIKL
jgi:guanylate kinase